VRRVRRKGRRSFAWLVPVAACVLALAAWLASRRGPVLVAARAAAAPATAAGGRAAPFPRPPRLGRIDITIVVDEVPCNTGLPADPAPGGLAILIETAGHTVLFDPGGRESLLVDNLHRLGRDPRRIEAVVLSHFAGDHLTGLPDLLPFIPDVPLYLPEMPPARSEDSPIPPAVRKIVIHEPRSIVPGVFTTGAMRHDAEGREQGLVVHTEQGPVLLVACGHPGHMAMARRVMDLTGERVLLVAGGFHFSYDAWPHEKRREVAALRALDPAYVAPFHCTMESPGIGEQIAAVWGRACLTAGNGAVLRIDPGSPPTVLLPSTTQPAEKRGHS
jgi:7,8-dihydropterin-6-yl-methyl-4-(beta-D-ribofuranosyl)aminobenzene 5'-phosphate synthase